MIAFHHSFSNLLRFVASSTLILEFNSFRNTSIFSLLIFRIIIFGLYLCLQFKAVIWALITNTSKNVSQNQLKSKNFELEILVSLIKLEVSFEFMQLKYFVLLGLKYS